VNHFNGILISQKLVCFVIETLGIYLAKPFLDWAIFNFKERTVGRLLFQE